MSERAPRTPREILEERARALARPASHTGSATFSIEALAFTLGRERFAVPSNHVIAVFPLAELVPLPGATPPVAGVTRWRGDVLTVLDLRRLVGSAPSALDDLGRVIVLGQDMPEFGVLADAVHDLVSIDPAALHQPPTARSAAATGLLRGVTSDGVHLVDAAALMARQADSSAPPDNAAPLPTTLPSVL